jgi:serine/threonine protein kinase/WD40 repeat protein/HEAT repeat protein
MINECSIAELELALAGDLPADREEWLQRHVEHCEACSSALEKLAGGKAWSDEAAALLANDEFDELDEALPSREEWSDIDFTVEHLDPCDEPGTLGRLGGYDVLAVIGRGGMGVVLKGYERELKRCVAIKVLAPHLAQSSLAKKRFTREAQAAAAVVHPNVLAIHSVQSGRRLPFLVMPLVAGESLAQRLTAQGRLELKETLRIGMQAAAGLAAAHEQGIVHRDVKPANILLEKGVERAVLTDFGLARAADDVSMTRCGVIAGTPQYMSPEQAQGETVDGRSDLFSLGCVLYEMSTGVSPFRADSTMATLRRLIDDRPPAMASLNAELPPWFIAIVDRLLQKDPAQRFASAKEVSEMLEGCLAHLQQPAGVPLPAAVAVWQEPCRPEPACATPPPTGLAARLFRNCASFFPRAGLAPRQASNSRKSHFSGVAIMLSLLGISLFAAAVVQTTPPDISGGWSGEEWGRVVLVQTASGDYQGTFSDTVSKEPGKLQLRWSRIDRRFNGTWSEGEVRFGELSLRLADGDIHGGYTTDVKSKINTPHLADFTWKRAAEHAGDQVNNAAEVVILHPVTPNAQSSAPAAKAVEKAVTTISTCAEFDPRVAKAMAMLQGLNDAEVVTALARYLDSQDANMRRAAIYILWKGQIASIEAAAPGLLRLCEHQEDLTRGMAALALGGKKVAASLAVLSKMTTDDKSGYARRCAAIALGYLGDPAAIAVLQKALKDPEFLVRMNAAAALKMLPGKRAEKAADDQSSEDLRAKLKRAEDELARVKALYDQKVISMRELERAQYARNVAEAQVALFTAKAAEDFDRTRVLTDAKAVSAGEFRRAQIARDQAKAAFDAQENSRSKGADNAPVDQVHAVQLLSRTHPGMRVGAIALSADGKWLAFGNDSPSFTAMASGPGRVNDGWQPAVQVLDAATGKIIGKLKLLNKDEEAVFPGTRTDSYFEVAALAYSPDGSLLAVGTTAGQVKLFEPSSGKLVCALGDATGRKADRKETLRPTLPRAMGKVAALAFSPDGRMLAVGGQSFADEPVGPDTSETLPVTAAGRLKLWDAKTGKLLRDLAGHSANVNAVAFSPDGKLLASAGDWADNQHGRGVRIWDLATGEAQRTIQTQDSGFTWSAAFSPDGKLLAIGSQNSDKDKPDGEQSSGTVRVLHVASGILEWTQTVPGLGQTVAFSADGKTVVALCGAKAVRLLDTETGKLKQEISLGGFFSRGGRWPVALGVAPQVHLLAVGGVDNEKQGCIEVWNLQRTGRASADPQSESGATGGHARTIAKADVAGTITRTFPLRFRLASQAADNLRQILLGHPGQEAKPSASNQEITITAPLEVMMRARTFITVTDWPDSITRGSNFEYPRDTALRAARSFFYACAIEDSDEAFSKLLSLQILATLKGDTKSKHYEQYLFGGTPDPDWEKSLRGDWPGKKEAIQRMVRAWNRYPLKRITQESGVAIGFGAKQFCSISLDGAPKDFYSVEMELSRGGGKLSYFFSTLPPSWDDGQKAPPPKAVESGN